MRRTTAAALVLALLATGALAQDDGAAEDAGPAAEDAGPAAEDAGPGEAGAEGEQTAPRSPEEALGLSMGEEAVGQTYTREEHGDWEVRCVRTESGADPCQLYQLLQDQGGNNVAEISVFPLPQGGDAVAGATIITPLETLLTAQIAMRVDSGEVKRYPFSFCSEVGCFSRVGFTADDVVSMRRGATAMLQIRPAAAPDQTVDLNVSLSGFTAGYETVAEANEAARAQQPQQ